MTSDMKRRVFITLLGGAAAAWPLAARAQQPGRTYKLAVLTANLREAPQNLALLEELRRRGFIEGQNVIVRGFNLRSEQLPEFAIESVNEGVDAILCGGGPRNPCRASGDANRSDNCRN
jgi:putative ABC transport system substrate-binding protein